MAHEEVICINCSHADVVRNGKSSSGIQRYRCRYPECGKTFQRNYRYRAYAPGVKKTIVDMALNGSGIRDTARVLCVSINTVMRTIKKKRAI